MKQDVYERVTNHIVAELEKGVRPWFKPWNAEHAAGRITRPLRANGQPYRGINVLMLWGAASERGYFSPAEDKVQMPPIEAFRDAEAYYATLAHEVCHWTKGKDRLERDFGRKRFGDSGYAMEELVAELGAAFLCADLALSPEPRDEHAAYLGHWLAVLQEDKRAIFSAAAHAQRAADYLHGLQPQAEEVREAA